MTPLLPSQVVEEASLHLEALSDTEWRIELRSPLGRSVARIPALTTAQLREWLTPPLGWRRNGAAEWDTVARHFSGGWPSAAALRRTGNRLADLLFRTPELLAAFQALVEHARTVPVRLQIALESHPPLLAGLPIELLAPALARGPFYPLRSPAYAGDPELYTVRYLDKEAATALTLPDRPRVLIATAHQDDRPPSAEVLVEHAEAVRQQVLALGWEPVVLSDATLTTLRTALDSGIDVLYLCAHGGISAEGSGTLTLRPDTPTDSTRAGDSGELTGEALKDMLAGAYARRRVQLVLLAGCSTAREPLEEGTQEEETWSMARFLVQADRGAVASLGFRHEAPVDVVLKFMGDFFRYLQEGNILEAAFARARACMPEGNPAWLLPLLYVRRWKHQVVAQPLSRPVLAPPHAYRSATLSPPSLSFELPLPAQLPPPSLPWLKPQRPAPPPREYFTGRTRELESLHAWIQQPGTVVLSALEGQGGVGKTELARQLAFELKECPPIWVERPEESPRAVMESLIQLVKPDFRLREDLDDKTLEQIFHLKLSAYRGLLILDDVRDPSTVARLTPGPEWNVLVTTQQTGLLPDSKGIEVRSFDEKDGIQLLSRLIWREDSPPADQLEALRLLVRDLEGLPLALELAGQAIHQQVLSVQEYREALQASRGVPAAHQTIVQEVLTRSLNWMRPDEVRCFMALGILPRAGARLEDVAITLGQPQTQVIDWLDRLVRQRLVRYDAPRGWYMLHARLWAEARERAGQDPETWNALHAGVARAMERMMEWVCKPIEDGPAFLGFVRWQAVSPMVDTLEVVGWEEGASGSDAAGRTLALCDTFRQLSWTPAHRRRTIDLAMRLTGHGSVWRQARVLFVRGGLRRDEPDPCGAAEDYHKALRVFRDLHDRPGQANVLQAWGELRHRHSDIQGALDDYTLALRLYGEEKSRIGQANVLKARGYLLFSQCKIEEALDDYGNALHLYLDLQDTLGQANVLKARGDLLAFHGSLKEASNDYEAAMHAYGLAKAPLGMAGAYLSRGALRSIQGNLQGASADFDEAGRLFAEVQSRLGQANVFLARGDLLKDLINYQGASKEYDAAHRLFVEVKDRLGQANVLQAWGEMSNATGSPNQAISSYEQALTLYTSIPDRWSMAQCLANLAHALNAAGRHEEALSRAREALELGEATGNRYAIKRALELLG